MLCSPIKTRINGAKFPAANPHFLITGKQREWQMQRCKKYESRQASGRRNTRRPKDSLFPNLGHWIRVERVCIAASDFSHCAGGVFLLLYKYTSQRHCHCQRRCYKFPWQNEVHNLQSHFSRSCSAPSRNADLICERFFACVLISYVCSCTT